jgi:DNA-binding GntR family transcriptional regulator
MARYREIYEDLRRRVLAGEFPVGGRLPSIADLMDHYDVPGLNTIRQAQGLLVEDGLVETRQGVGAFVISHEPTDRAVDVVAELRAARAAIDRALAALARADSPVAGR